MKQAIIRGAAREVEAIRRYLPSNYIAFTWGTHVWIEGEDWHGWTMEDYVIPRLRSGNYIVSQMYDY